MKNLSSKVSMFQGAKDFLQNIAKPVLPIVAAAGLAAMPLQAENRSNFNFSIGGFGFSNKDVSERYSGLFGGSVGAEFKLPGNYFRWGVNLSAFARNLEEENIEYAISSVQYESTIQAITKNNNGMIYAEVGPIYMQVHEKVSNGKEKVEGAVDAFGLVAKAGLEIPWKNLDWGTFIEYSYFSALRDNVQIGGDSLAIGLKRYLDR